MVTSGVISSSAVAQPPRLAIAQGDPAGIGAEVILKALAGSSWIGTDQITIIGNRSLLEQTYRALRQQSPILEAQLANPDRLSVLDVPLEASLLAQIQTGVGNAASGAASFRFLETAIAQTLAGSFQGVVTAPIAKSAWTAAGHFYPGQTELLAERASSDRVGMLFVAQSPYSGWSLRTLLATTHIPLRQVPEALTPALLTSKLELLIEALHQDFGLSRPRIAVAGLNPHSGEQGQLGREEQEWMTRWLKDMGDRFPQACVEGPIPPDTMWVRPGQAWYGATPAAGVHDAYLALYHDQGLIPVKLMAFDRAVNTTIGLPFVRTSPDHGTAFDIAGQGVADPASMKAALQLAVELVNHRYQQQLIC